MNSTKRFFSKYLLSSMGILLFFLTMNVVFVIGFLSIMQKHTIDSEQEIQEIADGISLDEQGKICADEKTLELLADKGSWAMVLREDGEIIWDYKLPDKLRKKYSVSDVAKFSRWYLEDYPVLAEALPYGLLVVGYQPDEVFGISMVKLYYVTDAGFIRVAIGGAVLLMVMNILLVIFLFWNNTRKVERAVWPILHGIDDISHAREIALPEVGELASVNRELNRAGEYIQKKDKARAEWINGVSHDVRTPLSVILGYAGEMEEDELLPPETRRQAEIISIQAQKLKKLIADLNLASRLEYAMQPLKSEKIDLLELGRQVVADLLNSDLDENYKIELDSHILGQQIPFFQGDMALLKRLFVNLIQNSISHNPNGCDIKLLLKDTKEDYIYSVSDNGIGISEERRKQLNQGIVSESNYQENGETAHGFGLKLVRQIAEAHGGKVCFRENVPKGLCVEIFLPKIRN